MSAGSASSGQVQESLREGFDGALFHPLTECPVCGASGLTAVAEARNMRAELPAVFTLVRCPTCRHVATDPMPEQAFLDYLYGIRSGSVTEAGQAAAQRDLTVPQRAILEAEETTRSAHYLEVGVGAGPLYARFVDRGWHCTGVDPAAGEPPLPGVVRSLDLLDGGERFDRIVALDALGRFTDPVGTLTRVRAHATSAARVWVTVPNSDSFRFAVQKGDWWMVRPLGQLHYFSRRSAIQLFHRARLHVDRIRASDFLNVSVRSPRSVALGAVQLLGRGDQWLLWGPPST